MNNICDIIMLSNTKSEKEFLMTKKALDTLYASEKENTFKTYLVESNKKILNDYSSVYNNYPNFKLIIPNEDFNFNKFINIALEECKNEIVGLLNNDVIFEHNWYSNIIIAMSNNNIDSASPFCPAAPTHNGLENKITYGWTIAKEFAGWCIVIKRESLNKILPLDEQFEFWCADMDMAMLLQKQNMIHALIGNSIVHHLGSQTLFTEPPDRINYLTQEMGHRFHKKYK